MTSLFMSSLQTLTAASFASHCSLVMAFFAAVVVVGGMLLVCETGQRIKEDWVFTDRSPLNGHFSGHKSATAMLWARSGGKTILPAPACCVEDWAAQSQEWEE